MKVLYDTKGWDGLSTAEKTAYSTYSLLESGAYRNWGAQQQKDFLKLVDQLKIPFPLPTLLPLGKDRKGGNLEDYSVERYEAWKKEEEVLRTLNWESDKFREKWEQQKYKCSTEPISTDASYIKQLIWEPDTVSFDLEKIKAEGLRPLTEQDVQDEKERRSKISQMESGKKVGKYEGDPAWDGVVPIPQDDGENPLAAIAYTDEYAEGMQPAPQTYHSTNTIL